jgi:hypothetical protein
VLRTLTSGLRSAFPKAESYLLSIRRGPLFDEDWWAGIGRTASEIQATAGQIAARLAERADSKPPDPILIVLDDADALSEGSVATAIEILVNNARDANAIVLAAMSTRQAARAYSGWVQAMRQPRLGFILHPDEDLDGDVFQNRLPRRAGMATPPGRGYLVQGNAIRLVQVATQP